MEAVWGILIDIFGVLGPIDRPPDNFQNIRYIHKLCKEVFVNKEVFVHGHFHLQPCDRRL